MNRDRVVLITGATRNIGRQLALHFADVGCSVAVNGRDVESIETVVDEIERMGGRALACPADIRSEEAVRQAVGKIDRAFGRVDVLINNAVVRTHGSLEEISMEDWEQVLDVVILGAVNCMRSVLPGMKSRSWGRIINMAGVSGQKGAANRAPVVAAKSGLIGLTKAVALEVASHSITVNAVSPGLINTEREDGLGDQSVAKEHYRSEAKKVPVGRMGTPEEVASICAYLCSEEAGFVTGQVVGVNGGLYM